MSKPPGIMAVWSRRKLIGVITLKQNELQKIDFSTITSGFSGCFLNKQTYFYVIFVFLYLAKSCLGFKYVSQNNNAISLPPIGSQESFTTHFSHQNIKSGPSRFSHNYKLKYISKWQCKHRRGSCFQVPQLLG